MKKENKDLYDLINKQINFEIYSAHVYLHMACFLAAEGLAGFQNFYMIQHEEELAHAKKLLNYLLERGYTPQITNWDETPAAEYTDALEVAKVALMHEQVVTDRFNFLVNKAREISDNATLNFLNWFIDEQVEEEANFADMIQKIKIVKDAGLYILDREYAQRVFVDPTKA